MKNLWVIPTDKPSRLFKNIHSNLWTIRKYYDEPLNKATQNQNIYITNSEDIKEGDIVKIPCGVGKVKELHWKYGNDNPSYIVEDIFTYKLRYGQKEGELQTNSFRYEDVKKIILTTDADLIKDGVQTIEDEFIQWFVKNSSCERVKVLICPIEGLYTIIPKEEVLIQSSIDGEVIWSTAKETLEEAAERLYPDGCDGTNTSAEIYRRLWIEGAKWQQERSYDNKEVLHLLDTLWDSLDIWYNEINSDKEFNLKEWFKNCELNKQKQNEQRI